MATLKNECSKPNCTYCAWVRRNPDRVGRWTKPEMFVFTPEPQAGQDLTVIFSRARRSAWRHAKSFKQIEGIVK